MSDGISNLERQVHRARMGESASMSEGGRMSRRTVSLEEVADSMFHAKSQLEEATILIRSAERELAEGLADLKVLQEKLVEQEAPIPR